jgi:hypothetical protein
MASKESFEEVFAALKPILEKYAGRPATFGILGILLRLAFSVRRFAPAPLS